MKHIASFRPRFFEVLRGYSRQTFSADLMAGLVVGIVALPLAIAFGIASGVSPEKGIITAVVAGFVVSGDQVLRDELIVFIRSADWCPR